ncbi:MAG: metallopeptidase TldD-related protein, partial [Pseudomonadales bacterium]
PRLWLFDDPGDSQGFGYAVCDDEGSLAQQTPLITAGTLQTLIHNSATAAHYGVTTTGHATRGPRSTLGVGLHQLKAQPGPSTEATCTAGRWLEVTDLTGLHSGANPISGEFSFGASGYLREGAQRIQPVRNLTVAGNFYSMINDVRDIGDTLHWNWQRSSCLPMIRFADISVSG